jgi:trans-o-hydroxybenzylidenepyruvate hydratase-aldolase
MRGLKDVGADGAFLGLPLWQTPTLENSVQFFADLSEAVPDMPIMVYANAMFFKSTFPTVFWEGVARKAPTVITTKIAYGIEHLDEDLRVAPRINFEPNHTAVVAAYQKVGTQIKSCWSTAAPMGPEPVVALMDAIQRDDPKRVQEIWADISALPPSVPAGEFAKGFPEYNAQVNKWFYNASGYIKPGPVRAPYRDLPEHWKRQAEEYARAWAALRQKYATAGATA